MVDDIRATLAASAQRAQQVAQMMALRDGFAAQAMAALIAGGVVGDSIPTNEGKIRAVVARAYEYADAMLRQRGQAVAAKGQPS